MDIWHACEPDKLGTEGWLGRATREIDPQKENVLTTVSFGPALRSVPWRCRACQWPVWTIWRPNGLLPGVSEQRQRSRMLERFAQMYSPAIGSGPVMDYLGHTGLDTLQGADILKDAPKRYASTVKYPDTPIAKKLKGIAQVHMADLGTRIFYCDHGSFDTHSNQHGMHDKLWKDVSEGVACFFEDLREHGVGDNVIMLMFSEFGRRVRDNGSGTDHGAGGVAFVLGESGQGRSVQRVSLHEECRICSKVTWSPTMTSGACTPRFWRSGWGWTPSRSSAGRLKSPRTSISRHQGVAAIAGPPTRIGMPGQVRCVLPADPT